MAKNLQTVARRALTPCGVSDALRLADGSTARDLSDLRQMAALKSALLVEHHRDAYAPWVERILGDPALARKVERLGRRRAPTPEAYRADLLSVLDERLLKLKERVL